MDETATKMRASGWRMHPTRNGTAWLRAVNDGSRSHVLICRELRGKVSAVPADQTDDPDDLGRWFVGRHANNGVGFVEVGCPDLDRCLAIWDAIPLHDDTRVLNEPYYDAMAVPVLRHVLGMLYSRRAG